MDIRNAYLLTVNFESDRTLFCKNLLEKIGFNVILFKALENDDKVLSNKFSMLEIYKIIANGNDEWCYVFEDDINLLDKIDLDEIIQYEKISEMFFYLGCCRYSRDVLYTSNVINGKRVYKVNKGVRGLHAIGISKKGASNLIDFSNLFKQERYMDVILEEFCKGYPANVVRHALESYIPGHVGIMFQDRKKFASLIG
jgi:hypothetical protein